jgi:hypothetical protein
VKSHWATILRTEFPDPPSPADQGAADSNGESVLETESQEGLELSEARTIQDGQPEYDYGNSAKAFGVFSPNMPAATSIKTKEHSSATHGAFGKKVSASPIKKH